MWREGNSEASNVNYLRAAKTRIVESDVSASLALQVFIYYNSWYSCMMFIIVLAAQFYKQVTLGPEVFNMIVYPIVFFWAIAEATRLYYGWSGNIKESFPELAAFLIISCLFSIPLTGALFLPFGEIYIIEWAAQAPQLIFLLLEIIFGCQGVKHLVKNQTAIFFLRNSKPDVYYRKTLITSKQVEHAIMSKTVGIPAEETAPY